MRSPLTVRVSDGVRDQQVTRFVQGLRFTKTAPGGHHSASVQIDAPEGLFSDLGPADRLYIYDGRSARTVWDGYVENPGRVTVAGGTRYDLSAMGGMVLASDNARAVVFIDQQLSHAHWQKVGNSAAAEAGYDEAAAGVQGIKAQFQPGTPIDAGSFVGMIYSGLSATGQPLLGVGCYVYSGKPDSGYESYINFYDDSGYIGRTAATPMASVDVNMSGMFTPPVYPYGTVTKFALVTTRTGAALEVADDLTWSVFFDLQLRPALRDKFGAFGNSMVSSFRYVRAHEVVHHVVGDMLPQIDGSTASIDLTSAQISQLTYFDGAKPQQILDDLTLYEPDYLWEVLEPNHLGKHRFNYRAWPTTPRYEISGREFTESGGEIDLCNRIAVSWTDPSGAEQTTIRTTTVPALGDRVKDAEPITLPGGQGSQGNAERIGDEVLAALNTRTRSGTAVIRQPIRDQLTGLRVMPWEIEPGYLVRVRDIGVDLRLTEMAYEDANCTASLTLGSPTLTLAQRLARLR